MRCATLRAERGTPRYPGRPLRAQTAGEGRRGQAADIEASDADIRDGHDRNAVELVATAVEETKIGDFAEIATGPFFCSAVPRPFFRPSHAGDQAENPQ
jgi:hypothetical protein